MGIIYSLFVDAKLKNDLSLEIHKSFRNKKKKIFI